MIRSAWMVACVLGVLGVPAARAEDGREAAVHDWGSADARRCRDESAVVGYRRCVPYAAWSRTGPNLFIEIGVVTRHLGDPAGTAVVARQAGTSTPAPTDKAGALDAISFIERVGVHVAAPLFIGAEVEIGTGIESDDVTGRRAVVLGGAGVIGLRGRVPYGALGIELVAGGRVIDDTSHPIRTRDEGMVEIRARAAVSLGPWFSLGIAGGRSLLDRDQWVAGLVLAADTYAFGQGR